MSRFNGINREHVLSAIEECLDVRRQNLSDTKGLDLREYPAHPVSFKPPCADGAAVGALSSSVV